MGNTGFLRLNVLQVSDEPLFIPLILFVDILNKIAQHDDNEKRKW